MKASGRPRSPRRPGDRRAAAEPTAGRAAPSPSTPRNMGHQRSQSAFADWKRASRDRSISIRVLSTDGAHRQSAPERLSGSICPNRCCPVNACMSHFHCTGVFPGPFAAQDATTRRISAIRWRNGTRSYASTTSTAGTIISTCCGNFSVSSAAMMSALHFPAATLWERQE